MINMKKSDLVINSPRDAGLLDASGIALGACRPSARIAYSIIALILAGALTGLAACQLPDGIDIGTTPTTVVDPGSITGGGIGKLKVPYASIITDKAANPAYPLGKKFVIEWREEDPNTDGYYLAALNRVLAKWEEYRDDPDINPLVHREDLTANHPDFYKVGTGNPPNQTINMGIGNPNIYRYYPPGKTQNSIADWNSSTTERQQAYREVRAQMQQTMRDLESSPLNNRTFTDASGTAPSPLGSIDIGPFIDNSNLTEAAKFTPSTGFTSIQWGQMSNEHFIDVQAYLSASCWLYEMYAGYLPTTQDFAGGMSMFN